MNKVQYVLVEIVAANPVDLLSKLSELDIDLYNAKQIDDLTYRFFINFHSVKKLMNTVKQYGGTCTIVSESRIVKLVGICKGRILLLLGIIFLVIITFYLPTRILFVVVKGNSSVPANLIIEKASYCGIYVGANRSKVRSEFVKNELIAAIPALKWVGINTDGCVTTIHVSEKNDNLDAINNGNSFSNVVASCDGVVIGKTILNGTPVCEIGEAVRSGQLLISGYLDCGLYFRATHAEGEILARTNHDVHAVTPLNCIARNSLRKSTIRYSLQIGKKLLKLYKDSGISDSTCVKIYKENCLIMPGGLVLPISFITEEIDHYSTRNAVAYDYSWLSSYIIEYIKEHMVAGQILDSCISTTEKESLIHVYGSYNCIEMIGKTKVEELFSAYGDGN